jgi:predicted PurR-regulated permease PerM
VTFGAVVLAAAALLGTVVASVVLAAAVTAAFDPLAARFRASGRSNIATAGLVTLTAAGLAALVIVLAVVAFLPSVVELLRGLKAGLAELETALESGSIPPPTSTLASELVTGVTDWVSGAATAAIGAIASMATIVLLAIFLLFFMINDGERSIAWMLQAAAPWQRATIAPSTVTARRRLGRSLRETAVRATATGGVTLVVALVLGLPVPFALAMLVFVCGFVPLLGLIAGTAAVGLVALGDGGPLPAILGVAALAGDDPPAADP